MTTLKSVSSACPVAKLPRCRRPRQRALLGLQRVTSGCSQLGTCRSPGASATWPCAAWCCGQSATRLGCHAHAWRDAPARPSAGAGRWLDPGQHRCLMLWRPVAGWADAIHAWARGAGLEDSVTTVEELSSGDEVAGTGARRLPVLHTLP